jgi:hypothetical protein
MGSQWLERTTEAASQNGYKAAVSREEVGHMMCSKVEECRVRRRHAFTPVALTMASTGTNRASTVL